jgi:predicted PurR-regulated permease PerM
MTTVPPEKTESTPGPNPLATSPPPIYDRRLARRFFITLLVLSGAAFVYMVRAFLIPVLLAAVFTTLFYPWYQRVLAWLGGRRVAASLLTCLIILVLLLGPVWSVGVIVARQAVELYTGVSKQVGDLFQRRDTLLHDLEQTPWFEALGLDRVDWAAKAQEVAEGAGKLAATVVNKTGRGTLSLFIAISITLFSMFYFFADGEELVRRLKFLSPLDERHENAIVERFASVARATVRGTVIIALVQATLGTVLLWACGVEAPILWGVVMAVLAFIPIVGVKLVLLPAGLWQILTGSVWQGVIIILASFVVILNVDNLLRPRLVGQGAKMHDLLIFFATLGGLGTFGIAGLIVGPVLAAFVASMLEIYASEFRGELEGASQAERLAPEPASKP